MTAPKTEVEWTRGFAQDRIRTAAAGLRDLADKFDRCADELDKVPTPGRATHVNVAVAVCHEHATWLANARLEDAIRYAAEADVAAEREKAVAS